MKIPTFLILGLVLIGTATVFLINRAPQQDEHQVIYQFKNFKRSYGLEYANASEESYRLSIFMENYYKVQEHNANAKKTYEMAINQFADLTQEEFKGKYLMKTAPKSNKDLPVLELKTFAAPAPINWANNNVLPPVKNQQQCGSCWAFSTAGMLEGIYNIKNGGVKSFSEQQLVDCCGAEGFGCEGCEGAWPTDAVSYAQKFGIVEEAQYPYTAKDGKCNTTLQGEGFKPSAQFQVAANDAALQAAVQTQPISICVDASTWSYYSKGVFNNCSSNPNAADHAVLLVGFNADNTWIVRNSWGPSWGNAGYITLAAGNTCGLENYAVYAQV